MKTLQRLISEFQGYYWVKNWVKKSNLHQFFLNMGKIVSHNLKHTEFQNSQWFPLTQVFALRLTATSLTEMINPLSLPGDTKSWQEEEKTFEGTGRWEIRGWNWLSVEAFHYRKTPEYMNWKELEEKSVCTQRGNTKPARSRAGMLCPQITPPQLRIPQAICTGALCTAQSLTPS